MYTVKVGVKGYKTVTYEHVLSCECVGYFFIMKLSATDTFYYPADYFHFVEVKEEGK